MTKLKRECRITKETPKHYEFTFRVNYQREGEPIEQTNMTIKVSKRFDLETGISMAKNHIETHLIAFHSFA